MKYFTLIVIAFSYFGGCSVFTLIVAENFGQVVRFHFNMEIDIRFFILGCWIPLVALCLIPNLKKLSLISTIANTFSIIGLGIVIYYCLIDMPINERPLHKTNDLPKFFGIAFFALESIGIVLPLENQMKNPQEMRGRFGVVSLGMTFVALFCGTIGFVGYAKYGDNIEGSISLNLPLGEPAAQTVKILIALGVFFTIPLEFYVVIETIWSEIESRIKKHKTFISILIRIATVSAAIITAILIPSIGPFVGLIGSFSSSILGFLLPVMIEVLTYWNLGYLKWNWMIFKSVVVFIFGLLTLGFGTADAIKHIGRLY